LLTNITADTTITAQYGKSLFIVTFLGKDGEPISERSVEYGSSVIPPEPPDIESWKFVGWDKPLDNIIANTTITAQYSPIPNESSGSGNSIAVNTPIVIQSSADVVFSYPIPDSKAGGYTLAEGTLPDGVSLRPYPGPDEPLFWEIYGITSIPGKYAFSIRNSKSGSIQKYSLEIFEHLSNEALIKNEILQEEDSYLLALKEAKDAILYSSFAYADFLALYFNGEELKLNDEYLCEEGSTRITIRAQTVREKTKPGNNTICAEFRTSEGKLQRSATIIEVEATAVLSATEVPLAVPTRYDDVAIKDWFYNDVEYVSESGLMIGTGPRIFSPRLAMSRAMLVTVLYRLEGEPANSADSSMESGLRSPVFSDITEGAWYYDAIVWAAENNIVEGYSSEIFGLKDPVTREQTVSILYRYAIMKELDVSAAADLAGYTDTDEISDWALDAMKWAVASGLINGRTATTTVPGGTSTRAEVTAIFQRYTEGFLSSSPPQS
jgi:hypothetical protein